MHQHNALWILLAILCTGCSGGHTQNQEKIRKQNAQAEYIRRRSCEKIYPEPALELVERENYPWEKEEKYTATTQN